MAEEDVRIPGLPKRTDGYKSGSIAVYNPLSDDTEQTTIQESLGADRADMDWQADTTYSTGDFVLYQDFTGWRSLQDNNTGNVPTEGTFWTAEPISEADGITSTEYATGLFTYNASAVQVSGALYFLNVAAPFKSTNFVTELANDDWITADKASVIRTVNAATYTVQESDLILHVTYTATGSVTITVPTALITTGFSEKVIKDGAGNATINSITILGEGGELIDDTASKVISTDYDSRTIYAHNNQMFIR